MAKKGNSPYDYLKVTKIQDLTQTELNSSIKNSFVPETKQGIDVIQIHKVKEAGSTFGANGVLPDSGAIASTAFTDAPTAELKPSANEVYQIDNLFLSYIVNGSSSTNAVTISLTDGTSTIPIHTVSVAGSAAALIGNPATSSMKLNITNKLWLKVIGDQSDESQWQVPYTLVAM
jgi:hypothetical protein